MKDAPTNVVPIRAATAEPLKPPVTPEFQTGLMEWVGRCWGQEPTHLPELVEYLSLAPGGGLRVAVDCSVRHWKTQTTIAAIPWWLKQNPKLLVAYISYSVRRAESVGKTIRDLCRRQGIEPAKEHNTIARWANDAGGGVNVMSAQQSMLGESVDVIICDDPYESGEECDKQEVRDAVDLFLSHYVSRLNVGGSCLLVMSPWRPDDALGVRVKERGWKHVHHPAISHEVVDGETVERALAPHIRTVDQLHATRAELKLADPSERTWFSQWMCSPFVPDASHFTEPKLYDSLPTWPGYRDIIGIDMAYSSKRAADWFAIVSIRVWGAAAYVTSCQRFKADEGLGEQRLREVLASYPHAPIYSYMSGPEIGLAKFFAGKGLHIQPMPARYNKGIRARRTIDRWRAGNVMWPSHMADLAGIKARFTNWRGLDGDADDEVDALVSACDGGFGSGPGSPIKTFGKPRW